MAASSLAFDRFSLRRIHLPSAALMPSFASLLQYVSQRGFHVFFGFVPFRRSCSNFPSPLCCRSSVLLCRHGPTFRRVWMPITVKTTPQPCVSGARSLSKGDALAQYNLGVLYRKGRGVPQDDVQARKWYEKAAVQGHAKAQFNLGTLYFNGEGVPKDYQAGRAMVPSGRRPRRGRRSNENCHHVRGWPRVCR